MNCISAARALDVTTSANGFTASCGACEIEHLSLGRLMKLSDSRLTSRIWELILSEKLRDGWKAAGACPRCPRSLFGVPFRHEGRDHAIIACSECHMVAMKGPTLSVFRAANGDEQARLHAEARAFAQAKFQTVLERDVTAAKRFVRTGADFADHLLNETPLREIRVTVISAAFAVLLGAVATVLPYTAMEIFGGPTGATILAAFIHVTFFHLAWNLLFFLPLAAAAERALGSLRFAVVFGLLLWVSVTLGRALSPFPDTPLIGLSPVVAALLGRNLVLGIPLRFGKYRLPAPTVALIFFLSEFRTMMPTSGGMKWFTLSACIVGALLSAALAEWRRRSVPGGESGKNVVVLRSETAVARRTDVRSPPKRAA